MHSLELDDHMEYLGNETVLKLESLLNTSEECSLKARLKEDCGSLRSHCAMYSKENKRLSGEIDLCLNENSELEEKVKQAKKELIKRKTQVKMLLEENEELKSAGQTSSEILIAHLKKCLESKDKAIQQLQGQIQELSLHIAEEYESSARPMVRTSKLRASREVAPDDTMLDIEGTGDKHLAFKVSRTFQQRNIKLV